MLDEMRKAYETRNFSYLPGLIEEIQSAGNRMEAALYDQNDLQHARREYKKLQKEIKMLQEKRDKLNESSTT